jgi:hypothetical protein
VTLYAFPSITPNQSHWSIVANTSIFRGFNGAIQTQDRGGERWAVELRFGHLRADEKAVMKAFLARLNGSQHRFTLHDHSQIQRGAFGGTPLVNGASQTGGLLIIDGASLSVTGWIKAGDHFSVGGELKMATGDADSDGAGGVQLEFTPRIRNAPANNEPVIIADPPGTFLLATNESDWSNSPGDFSDFVIKAIEDIAI